MRLLLVADVSPVVILGGGERVLREHALRLKKRGHEVTVLCRTPGPDAPDAVRLDGVEVLHLPADRSRPWGWVFGAARRGGRVAAHLAADVTIAYQPITASGVARGGGAPLIYVFLSSAGEEYRTRHPAGPVNRAAAALLHRTEAAVLARADRVVVLSEFSRDQLARCHTLDPADVLRIPGGVDPAVFRPAEDRAALRRRLDLPADGPLLITVRNLVPRMGLDDLIRAMAAVTAAFPEAMLLIGGDGPLRGDLGRLAETVGVAARTRFLGYVPEEHLPDLLRAADLFVLPTRMLEGFGLVTVEALACGTPVVGTPVGATPELLGPLGAGLLLSGVGPAPLSEGILARLRAAAADPAAAAALRRACRDYALTYDWERAVEALEGLVRDLAPRPCPFCGTAAARPVLQVPGRRYDACAGCGTLRRRPAPDREGLSRFYRDEYAASFLAGSDHPRRRAMFAALLKPLGPARGRRLLDLGAGSGLFVRIAREAGWEADGTELSTESRAWARTRHGITLRDPGTDPLPVGAYDVVSLVNVLDQAPDPAALLGAARAALRPGGRLLLRVPNAALHARWIRATARLGLGGLAVLHGYGFTPASLRAALLSQGFRVLALRNAAVAEGAGVAAHFGPLAGFIRVGLVGLAGAAAWLSGGRLLWGASLEAEAEKLPEGAP
ncbi:MAG: glycosyltransferase [candidate division NC10 bacterium]|nr:glycosyltransferase [candidate division NC10 bacterium]